MPSIQNSRWHRVSMNMIDGCGGTVRDERECRPPATHGPRASIFSHRTPVPERRIRPVSALPPSPPLPHQLQVRLLKEQPLSLVCLRGAVPLTCSGGGSRHLTLTLPGDCP